jgi:2-amino-4-hydroxy-6-hydroxymethyldihydropteridine diphosphokinase
VNEYLIAFGSNLGDRLNFIREALEGMDARCGMVTARSHLYETPPIGAADQTFINGAVILSSNSRPDRLLKELLAIEQDLGRTREVHWGNRTIDLDILLGRDSSGTALVMASGSLMIPHPRMLDRDFVLVPACDIAGDWLHPKSGRKLGEELTSRFPGGLQVSYAFAWSR